MEKCWVIFFVYSVVCVPVNMSKSFQVARSHAMFFVGIGLFYTLQKKMIWNGTFNSEFKKIEFFWFLENMARNLLRCVTISSYLSIGLSFQPNQCFISVVASMLYFMFYTYSIFSCTFMNLGFHFHVLLHFFIIETEQKNKSYCLKVMVSKGVGIELKIASESCKKKNISVTNGVLHLKSIYIHYIMYIFVT